MKFYFPDSQDQIDPSFDFLAEQRSPHRVRQRDDRYAHEVFSPSPYDGLLVSKPIVDGMYGSSGKYTEAQRHRLYREGAQRFFRLDIDGGRIEVMGDCGAFTYVREYEPVYELVEVLEFYDECGFDVGISMDHLIFGYSSDFDSGGLTPEPDWVRRQQITLEYAAEFLELHRSHGCKFEAVAVAHGWSPASYRRSVESLQRIGYERIALGGMVPLKTAEIMQILEGVADSKRAATHFHLLGINRVSHVSDFRRYGVTSFDSTSPFLQAFKDDKDNYHTLDSSYTAIRVPQVDGNTRLRQKVTAGQLGQATARDLEQRCLARLRAYDRNETDVASVLSALSAYNEFLGISESRRAEYERTLECRPWNDCACDVCQKIGIEVIIFRGTDRNKRRGFHNLTILAERLRRELELDRAGL